jgi:hypothetical protein
LIENFPLAMLASHRSVSFQGGKKQEPARSAALKINILRV